MDEVVQSTLEYVVLGNSLLNWLVAAGIAAAVYAAILLVRNLLTQNLARVAHRTANVWDDIVLRALMATRQWFVLILAGSAGSSALILGRAQPMILALTSLAVLVQIGIWGTAVIRGYVEIYGRRNLEGDAGSVMTVRAIGYVVSILLWVVVLLVVLENLGIDVTALVAGLGIGGIAVALATQNVLKDLFGSLSIVLDKPFVVGDFIVVDSFSGTVERVGLKTTRIKSLSGEQLVFANTDLLESRIQNFKRMYERRAVFTFGVKYGTSRRDLEWVAEQVTEIVVMQPGTRFDRAHFHRFGTSALEFEVVYILLDPDYNAYMDTQQTINLELLERLETRGVSLALPARVVRLTGDAVDQSTD